MFIAQESAPSSNTIAVFRAPEHLDLAVIELIDLGFDRTDITILMAENTIMRTLKQRYRQISELGSQSGLQRRRYVSDGSQKDGNAAFSGRLISVGLTDGGSSVFATDDNLAATIVATSRAIGADRSLSDTLAQLLGRSDALFVSSQLDRTGIVVWIRTRSSELARLALDVLEKHWRRDIHAYTVRMIGK